MPKRNVITATQLSEIESARKATKNKKVDRRLKALSMHAVGTKRAEIAKATEYNEAYISELVTKYCNHGLGAIVENHYKGNHRNLSFEEEAQLLEEFREEAESGQIVATKRIKEAYETKTGKSLDDSHGHIYTVLKRHNWRQVMPRSKHPNKASDEEIESSKKLT